MDVIFMRIAVLAMLVNFDAGSAEMQALHGHVAIGHNRYYKW